MGTKLREEKTRPGGGYQSDTDCGANHNSLSMATI